MEKKREKCGCEAKPVSVCSMRGIVLQRLTLGETVLCGRMLLSHFLHCLSQNCQGGKQSFLWHQLLKTSPFFSQWINSMLPSMMDCVLCVDFAPFWHRAIPPPPEPLSNCESPFEASDPGRWMRSLCELEKRAALSDVLLNLHKNWFTLPLGV